MRLSYGLPVAELIAEGKLSTYHHEGFWGCMDTFKEKQMLDDLWRSGEAPWNIWRGKERAQPFDKRPSEGVGVDLI